MTDSADQTDPVTRAIKLTRPLAAVAIRATGTDPDADRVVEIAILRAEPDAQPREFHTLVDPGPVTPRVATCPYALKGAAARGLPRYDGIAAQVITLLGRCDPADFDPRAGLPLLSSELRRVGLDLPPAGLP